LIGGRAILKFTLKQVLLSFFQISSTTVQDFCPVLHQAIEGFLEQAVQGEIGGIIHPLRALT
jgi:hypothetical protein